MLDCSVRLSCWIVVLDMMLDIVLDMVLDCVFGWLLDCVLI